MTTRLIAPSHMRGPIRSADRTILHERRDWMQRQRDAGYTVDQIATAVGLSPVTVDKATTTPKVAPAPVAVVARTDRRVVVFPAHGRTDTETAVARVSLSRAPWEPEESRPDHRPETNPRFSLVRLSPAKPRDVAGPALAAIRAMHAEHMAGVGA